MAAAAGAAGAVFAGNAAARRSEEARRRRALHAGYDHALIRVGAGVDSVGKAVAEAVRGEWEDGEVRRMTISTWGRYVWPPVFFLVGLALFSMAEAMVIDILFCSSWFDCPPWPAWGTPLGIPLSYNFVGAFFLAVYSFMSEITPHWETEPLDVVQRDGYTSVEIHRYDSNGYRNFSEETIHTVYDKLQPLGIIIASGFEDDEAALA